jgi:hypothetical protein
VNLGVRGGWGGGVLCGCIRLRVHSRRRTAAAWLGRGESGLGAKALRVAAGRAPGEARAPQSIAEGQQRGCSNCKCVRGLRFSRGGEAGTCCGCGGSTEIVRRRVAWRCNVTFLNCEVKRWRQPRAAREMMRRRESRGRAAAQGKEEEGGGGVRECRLQWIKPHECRTCSSSRRRQQRRSVPVPRLHQHVRLNYTQRTLHAARDSW